MIVSTFYKASKTRKHWIHDVVIVVVVGVGLEEFSVAIYEKEGKVSNVEKKKRDKVRRKMT